MKRTPLSLIRLYKLANDFMQERQSKVENMLKKEYALIVSFLKYINEHKNDSL